MITREEAAPELRDRGKLIGPRVHRGGGDGHQVVDDLLRLPPSWGRRGCKGGQFPYLSISPLITESQSVNRWAPNRRFKKINNLKKSRKRQSSCSEFNNVEDWRELQQVRRWMRRRRTRRWLGDMFTLQFCNAWAVCVSSPGLPPSDLHRLQDPDPAGDVSQGLDRHAVGHQQVRFNSEFFSKTLIEEIAPFYCHCFLIFYLLFTCSQGEIGK